MFKHSHQETIEKIEHLEAVLNFSVFFVQVNVSNMYKYVTIGRFHPEPNMYDGQFGIKQLTT